MGLETPNAGPIPLDVFIGFGWSARFVFEGEDLSDIAVARLGLTRIGRPTISYALSLAAGDLELAYVPPQGEEATGAESPNAIVVCIPGPTYATDGTTVVTPAGNASWIAGRYAFTLGATRGDGAPFAPIFEGFVQIKEPA